MKYITVIKELDTATGPIFKDIYYDGDLASFYDILNAKDTPRFMYFIPMSVTEDNDEEFESIIIKTDEISYLDVTEKIVSTDDIEDDEKEDSDGDLYLVNKLSNNSDYDIAELKSSKKFFAENKEYIDILDNLLAELKKHE